MMNRGCIKLTVFVSAIIFILSTFYYLKFLPELRNKILLNSLERIKVSVKEYNDDYPNNQLNENSIDATSKLLGINGRKKMYLSVDEVIINNGIISDYWNNPIQIKISEKNIKVFSIGRNNIANDQDDIIAQ
tara:strand:+ start:188 stop:583 length:396 start_codon:yes stop_codon:yes gene_type:complete